MTLPELSGRERWWDCGLFLTGAAGAQGLGFLSAWPDTATETQGSASHPMRRRVSHFYMPRYTHHF